MTEFIRLSINLLIGVVRDASVVAIVIVSCLLHLRFALAYTPLGISPSPLPSSSSSSLLLMPKILDDNAIVRM